MSKKKVILGVFIMMAMAICGVFLTKIQPQVFASEISANQNQEVVTKAGANAETIINEAGIFIGQGYYEINQHAKLIAQMNDGYAFVGWYVAGTETCLSTQSEYTFVVTSNMTIEFRWRKIEYQILFADDMWKSHNVELKDFTYTIQNRTEEGRNKYYYSDMVDVVLETKEDSFIAEFNPSNVTINGVASTSLRFAGAAIEHDSIEGVTKVTISLGIDKEIINNEKIVIDIDYVNMYKFTIKSANSIGIGNLMQFITLNDAVKNRVLDENNYVYLVRADQLVTITNTLGNDVYQFVTTQFTGYEPTTSRINSYTLYRHSELLVNYSAILYTMNFGSYLKNEHNNYDAMSEFPYVIGDMGIVAGEQVTFDYNDENRKITITNSQGDSVVYNYDENIYGYQFAGFAVNKEILTDNTYTLSTTEPINVEIQLIFESIKYKVEVILIDEYFESGVTYQKEYNDIIKNTTINLTAETNIYLINGWSDNANPKVNGYLQQATDGTKKDTYSFKFEPTTDDNSIVYTIYLDVDYEYISVEYALNKSSIKQNVDYNVITWDRENKKLTFTDSENINPEQVVEYVDDDVTISGTKTIIKTTTFGDVEIEDGTLRYFHNLIKNSSYEKEDKSASVTTYKFNKYTYFADLVLGLVENVTLVENAGNYTINLNGTSYTDNTTLGNQVLMTGTSTSVSVNNEEKKYTINCLFENHPRTIELYLNDDNSYKYLVISGTVSNIQYYYNGSKFIAKNAEINKPDNVVSEVTKSSNYNITLNNMLPNMALIYLSKTVDVNDYEFTNYTNATGTGLGTFDYSGYKACMLTPIATAKLTATYHQLTNGVILEINNTSAYAYENILFTIEGVESTEGTGADQKIDAYDGDNVTIIIEQGRITPGYQFVGYTFAGNNVTQAELFIYTFKMSDAYANKMITLNFAPIQYQINVNYVDDNGDVITDNSKVNGWLRLRGQAEAVSTLTVDVTGTYDLEVFANDGYFVDRAYLGAEGYVLNGLIGDNANLEPVTSWQLNSTNFAESIITQAGEGVIVNLYIRFAIHTYSVAIYFEIDENASRIAYPTIYINNNPYEIQEVREDVDGTIVTRRCVTAQGFGHGSNVEFEIKDIMTGISILSWNKDENIIAGNTDKYTFGNINKDTILLIKLEYISYTFDFVIVDENYNESNNGSAYTTPVRNASYKLFNTVSYASQPNAGYVLKGKYYYDSIEQKIELDMAKNQFEFNPAAFKIEDGSKIKLYFVFGFKTVQLSISNELLGKSYIFEGQDEQTLATFGVTRKRGENISTLDKETGYEFKTGDVLTMAVTPSSIGIQLNRIYLGNIEIGLNSQPTDCKLTTQKKIVEDKLIVYYVLEITFTEGLIYGLSEEVELINSLRVREYTINYSYNFINYKMGISLTRSFGNSRLTGEPDEAMVMENFGYGVAITFGYSYEGMNTGTGDNFVIDHYSIAENNKAPNASNNRFVFGCADEDCNLTDCEGMLFWEQVASQMFEDNNSTTINVVLVIKPKITINRYTKYTEQEGYLYERTYNGEYQGLTSGNVSGFDIIVKGEFVVELQYSADNGLTFGSAEPIDVGVYPVEIIATIPNANDIRITFDEKVTIKINPASINISLKTFNNQNPITKVYNGDKNINTTTIANDIKFTGVFNRDIDANSGNPKIYINVNVLKAEFSNSIVNSNNNLYDVIVSNIQLLGENSKPIKNYVLASGDGVIFNRIGKINPKTLIIGGYTIQNPKVYDGTNSVNVNIDQLVLAGKLNADSVEIVVENLKFYLKDYSIGENREVVLDSSNALSGADSVNYTIKYTPVYINVLPYELTYDISGYGTVKVVDQDRLGKLAIGSRIYARAYEKGSNEYRGLYTRVQSFIKDGQKLNICYEIILQVGAVSVALPEGVYVYLPKAEKVANVLQVPNDSTYDTIKPQEQGDYVVVKIGQGDGLFAVITNTVYLPLWAIILIVVSSLTLVGVGVAIFVAVRRKTKRKYSAYDRI